MTQEQQRTYPHGVTSWIDVDHQDTAAAERFYAGLFGWTFTPATPPDSPFRYAIARLDGHDVAGLGGPADPGSSASATPPGWNTYVAVDDVATTLAAVEAAGGRVVQPAAPAGEGGTSASCADPSGAAFRLWQAARRPGVQVANVPGAWNFSDLATDDPEVAARFYGEVFGWELDDIGYGTLIRVPGYGDHLAATVDPGIHERQSGVSAPPGFADAIGWVTPLGDLGPGWHVSFTVADRDRTAELAASLGGRVLRTDDTAWTRLATIADTEGAVFTASQFTPPEG